MGSYKSLSLPHRLELTHPSLPYPGRLMRLLCPIVLVLFGTVDRLGYQLSMGDTIASQLVGHDLPGLASVASQ